MNIIRINKTKFSSKKFLRILIFWKIRDKFRKYILTWITMKIYSNLCVNILRYDSFKISVEFVQNYRRRRNISYLMNDNTRIRRKKRVVFWETFAAVGGLEYCCIKIVSTINMQQKFRCYLFTKMESRIYCNSEIKNCCSSFLSS